MGRLLRRLVWLIVVPMLFKVSSRKLVLFLILLTVARSKLIWNWLMLGELSMTSPPSTPRPDLTRDILNLPYTPCTLKLMTCFPRLRTLRRNPRRLWLMPPVLLMNLELNKSTLDNKRRPNALLNLKLVNLINV